jgi:hypothetical protein
VDNREDKARACRGLADDIRLAADALAEPERRASMLRIAASYERLADRVEGIRASAEGPPP